MNLPEHINRPFDLRFFRKESEPIIIRRFDFDRDEFGQYKCLHLLIQQDGKRLHLPEELEDKMDLKEFIGITQHEVRKFDFMYCYLTIDTTYVKAGQTQRTPGWHVDGLQGDEVPTKYPSDITFTWCDRLPPEVAVQSFDLPDHVNLSEYNIFECLSILVQNDRIGKLAPKTIYAMDSYCVHRGSIAPANMPRTFIRVSYTHIPVTSTKMTINPKMPYNYEIHTTTGNIPKDLKILYEIL